jgi:hypothetical protein
MAAAEQAIVKWEDDSEVRKCRICLYVPSSLAVQTNNSGHHSHYQTENTTVEFAGV